MASRDSGRARSGSRTCAHNQTRLNNDLPSIRRVPHRVPAHGSIGAEFLPLDKGHVAMSKRCEMLQGERSGLRVIENNVCHSGHIAVAGDCYERNLDTLGKGRINCYQTLYRPLLQQEWILFDELAAMPVAHHKIEVSLLEQMILNPRHDQGRVSLADFRHHHADGVASLLTK